jgi:PAS domain S-box-containing protein
MAKLSVVVSKSLLSGLNHLIQRLLNATEWESAVQEVLAILGKCTPADRVVFWQLPVEDLNVAPQAWQVWFKADSEAERSPLPEFASQRLHKFLQEQSSWQGLQAVVCPDNLPPDPMWEHGILLLPLRIDGQLQACLSFERWAGEFHWSSADLELLQNFALQFSGILAQQIKFVQFSRQSLALWHLNHKVKHSQPCQDQQSREDWLNQQNQALINLSQRNNQTRGDLLGTLQNITKTAAEILKIARCSVWIYPPDHQKLSCLNLYECENNSHSQGAELEAGQYSEYFRAIEQARTIAADNARTDWRTQQFTETYLKPLGITAMLDAPIWQMGKIIGVICNEHIGDAERHWTIEEQHFAASIADLVSLAIESYEHYQAEAALRESEERLQSFFDATFETVAIHDQGRILDVNYAAETMFGYTASEMVGMLATQLAPPEMHQRLIERIRQPIEEPYEMTGLRKDGSTFIGELSGKSIMYRGRPARVVGIRDISERKQAELALAALNANLEQQVEERTAQLHQKMLELQELNKLKDVLLHAVSHDLRTPVMGTLMVLNNLLEAPPSLDVCVPQTHLVIPRLILERMLASNERQKVLIDSLLESHAHELSGMVLHRQPTDLLEVLHQILGELEPLLEKNQARVTLLPPAHLPLLDVDLIQLQRVYENLITNALKHNPLGLSLKLDAQFDASQQFLYCTLQDDGIGISADQAEHLFDLYFRGQRSHHLTGIGLGLYLCRQIIEAHGGEIGVISAPHQGSTFWFTLPVHCPTATATPSG